MRQWLDETFVRDYRNLYFHPNDATYLILIHKKQFQQKELDWLLTWKSSRCRARSGEGMVKRINELNKLKTENADENEIDRFLENFVSGEEPIFRAYVKHPINPSYFPIYD